MPANPHYTESLRKLMQAFADLPGVGMRSPERMAFALLKEPARATALLDAIHDVKNHVHYSSICFNLTEHDPCPICAHPTALYLQQQIASATPNTKITRLARGLPAGAQIEYSNKAILSDALAGRTSV